MLLKLDELPCAPEADRILVLPDPPEEETIGKLEIPEIARMQASSGRILDAGLKARDVMYDNGQEIGDTIWYGKFAGVWEEWDHIVKLGKKKDCKHAEWSRAPSENGFRKEGFSCDECGAIRRREPVLIMNVGDICGNVSKAARIREGKMSIEYGVTAEGRTQHYVPRQYAADITSTLSNRIERTTNGAS